jgi:hypothetical protein
MQSFAMGCLGNKIDKMTRLLWVIGFLLCATGSGFSQDDGARTERKDWQARVDRARQRVEKLRKEGSFVPDEQESFSEAIKERTIRALDDEDLRPGDLVSTKAVFFGSRVFRRTASAFFLPSIRN